MLLSRRSALHIFLIALSMLGVLFGLSSVTKAVEAGPDWMTGAISFTKTGDSELVNGDESMGNIPCESISAYSWGWLDNGWNRWNEKSKQADCAASGATGYIGYQQVLPYGAEYWQKLDLASLYSYPSTYSNAGTNGLAMITNSYGYSSGVPELYYTDDVFSTFSAFSKDSAGNVVRSQSKPFDHKLTYADGRALPVTGIKAISYSANGRWMYLNISNLGQLRVSTDDFSVFSLASSYIGNYALYTATSNSGNTVATHAYQYGLKLYDLTDCEAEKPDYGSRECASRDATQELRNAVAVTVSDVSKLGWVDVSGIKFVTESQIKLFVRYVYNGEGKAAFFTLSVAAPEQSVRYLALGDSFSSGEGAFNYRNGTNFYLDENEYNLCHQSLLSYSYLLKKSLSPAWFGSVACSGATQGNINYDQGADISLGAQAKGFDTTKTNILASITTGSFAGYVSQNYHVHMVSPTVATISTGGNDIGFGDIVTACVVNKFFRNLQSCSVNRFDREQVANSIDAQIPKLAATFRSIKQNLSGDQKLYVVGYPKIVNYINWTCSLNVPMDPTEREFADNLVDYLNDAVRIAANEAGARFLDMSSAFVNADHDYRLCGGGDVQAVNGIMMDSGSARKASAMVSPESFHPNQLGQSLLAQQIRALTNDFSLQMPQATLTSSVPDAEHRIRLVGDNVITNTNQSFNYITDSLPNFVIDNVVNAGVQTLKIVSEVPGTIAQNISATVELHSTPINVGQATVKTDNTISATVSIPGSVAPGYHQLHILYTDSSGQDFDLYKYVLVVASADDYDGDGVKNDDEPCVVGDGSGIDSDKDGIDDACDGEYVSVPDTESQAEKETGTDNTDSNEPPIGSTLQASDESIFNDYAFTLNANNGLKIENTLDGQQTQSPNNEFTQRESKDGQWLLILGILSIILLLSTICWRVLVVRKRY